MEKCTACPVMDSVSKKSISLLKVQTTNGYALPDLCYHLEASAFGMQVVYFAGTESLAGYIFNL